MKLLSERLVCLNLYEALFIMFSARTTVSEILENMLFHLRAETLGERLICLNLCEIFLQCLNFLFSYGRENKRESDISRHCGAGKNALSERGRTTFGV